ncbi:hypothetical protein [Novosphingobium album (ex Liu et al. 2023)]|uniref:DUF3024 domain-containing protein n=1 Tax=Novosphingobium album (ex Liu et al. 2023) TaxID=3031130 RepID=A0ABT5WQB0_9SPHN|nr:hypothetical protein [Novosphingobium album (ex Liu et al. 2023)]MDE8652223.1 hypothetical protein [Novosphingobium album (ex Liu et al. 2023)]
MSIASPLRRPSVAAMPVRHPNELDRMRVARSIEQRSRYRYVAPRVLPVDNGYLVRSPCCSRNVDPHGGEIDVALLSWNERDREWALLRRDHAAQCWIEDGRFARLGELLLRINTDPMKLFWQ